MDKGSNTARFFTALIIAVVSFFGLTTSFGSIACGYFAKEYRSASERTRERVDELRRSMPRGYVFDTPNALKIARNETKVEEKEKLYNAACDPLTGYPLYFSEYSGIKDGLNILFGTLVIDGIVLGVYQFFGKSKESTEKPEAKETN